MNIVITGSLGHIGQPLATELVQKGHSVTVISSKPDKQTAIQAIGATAAVGSLEDVAFLTAAFTGADAVYCMVPPANYFDHSLDLLAYYRRLGRNYSQAIRQSGVKRVVNLSSVGADLVKGSGLLFGAHEVEQLLDESPSDVAITHVRPMAFYYNLYGYTHLIKQQALIAANHGADDTLVWVSPIDIAAVVAQELVTPFDGSNVRYVASDELTGHETARILGEAIGKPDLTWVLISNEQMQSGLVAAGMNPQIAAGLVEMYESVHSGVLQEDYFGHKPAVMGKVKMTDFAREFATAFARN